MYGTTCLNVIGLGRKLPLVKFQNKMGSSVKVKCRFCDKDYVEFVRLSEHMLRAHHEEFDDLVKGVLVRGEASEGSSEKSTSVEGKSGESSEKGGSSEKGKSSQRVSGNKEYICEVCEKSYNNAPARDSHQILCSGIPNKPKCPPCGKVFESRSGYKKHKSVCKGAQ